MNSTLKSKSAAVSSTLFFPPADAGKKSADSIDYSYLAQKAEIF
jgi:hypothetical protein